MSKKHSISKEDIDSLCKEVNSFDKEFGIKLKSINPFSEPEMVFESYVDYFQTFLFSVIYELNGIGPDKYLT